MKYHVVINGEAKGPFTPQEAAELGINKDTLVWYQGIDNWIPASSVPEINSAIEAINATRADEMPPLPASAPAPATVPVAEQMFTEATEATTHTPMTTPQPETVTPPQPATATPGQTYTAQVPDNTAGNSQRPSNNLVMAIIGLALFFPLGIPALVKALTVNRLWNQGQHDLAISQANAARRFGTIAIIIGAIFQTIFFLAAIDA